MLGLEPLFCKSTGAYRAQVSQFCNLNPKVKGRFKLAPARRPSGLDADAWVRDLPLGTLRLDEHILIFGGARSIIHRDKPPLTILLQPRLGVVLEVETDDISAEGVIHAIRKSEAATTGFDAGFDSLAITLIRHGLLTLESETNPRTAAATGLFQAENGVEILEVEGRRFARASLTGRVVEITDNPALAELFSSRRVIDGDEESRDGLERLCRLGLFRQIWSLK